MTPSSPLKHVMRLTTSSCFPKFWMDNKIRLAEPDSNYVVSTWRVAGVTRENDSTKSTLSVNSDHEDPSYEPLG